MSREPGAKSAVEERGRTAEHAQHHDQSSGRHASGVVVGHDPGVVSDADFSHGVSEVVGCGKRMTPVSGCTVTSEVTIDVDEHRAGNVAGLESSPSVATVEIPADVGHDDTSPQVA